MFNLMLIIQFIFSIQFFIYSFMNTNEKYNGLDCKLFRPRSVFSNFGDKTPYRRTVLCYFMIFMEICVPYTKMKIDFFMPFFFADH